MNLRDEAFAARSLLAVLAEDLNELDEETEQSVIESETGLIEAIERTLRANAEDEGHILSLKTMIASMEARMARKATRIERRRGAIMAAMEIAGGIKRLELAAATVSVSKGKRKVIITDADLIPDSYKRQRVIVEASKDKILGAMLTGQAVPGAELSNAMPTLRVMTK